MSEEREYMIPCRITRKGEVTVVATSHKEAIQKFESLDWLEENPGNEICDFERIGPVKAYEDENKP